VKEKPNLVFIFTDEQAAKTMAAYGNKMIETPNLNKLADESIVFENTYVTQPVCTPSRSTLMTGFIHIMLDIWREMASQDQVEETVTDPIRTVITPEGWKFNYSQRSCII